MKENRPALVQYIVDLNFLNAFLLAASLFPKFWKHFGVITPSPTLSNVIFRIFEALILISISYGLLKLKKWGYWLMIAYNLVFLSMSVIFLFMPAKQSLYYPGVIISILGLSLIFSAKRYFIKESL